MEARTFLSATAGIEDDLAGAAATSQVANSAVEPHSVQLDVDAVSVLQAIRQQECVLLQAMDNQKLQRNTAQVGICECVARREFARGVRSALSSKPVTFKYTSPGIVRSSEKLETEHHSFRMPSLQGHLT